MGSEKAAKKFTWVIKNFSSLPSEIIYSDQFVVGGCKWRLKAYPKGNNDAHYLSLYLDVAESESLPSGWRRHAKVAFTIVNQIPHEVSEQRETIHWFDNKEPDWGFKSMFPLIKLDAEYRGFLMNGEVKIVAEVEVLEVIGKLDVLEETSTVMETIDVNGFQVLPSQVKYVKRLFERHPDIATKFRIKNQQMKIACMNVLLSVTETLRHSPSEISKDDLADAYAALESMSNAGFKLDWLENKLDEVKKKKQKVETSEIRMQEIENEMKDLKHKCSDLEAELVKEKAEVLAALSFSDDDVV